VFLAWSNVQIDPVAIGADFKLFVAAKIGHVWLQECFRDVAIPELVAPSVRRSIRENCNRAVIRTESEKQSFFPCQSALNRSGAASSQAARVGNPSASAGSAIRTATAFCLFAESLDGSIAMNCSPRSCLPRFSGPPLPTFCAPAPSLFPAAAVRRASIKSGFLRRVSHASRASHAQEYGK
jgi:hypothetical protein